MNPILNKMIHLDFNKFKKWTISNFTLALQYLFLFLFPFDYKTKISL